MECEIEIISLKKVLKDRALNNLDISKGLMRSLLNPFYHSNPKAFPYERSIRAILKALEFPQNCEQIDEYPDDSHPGWTDECQGVTNDGSNWFITQRDGLWKFPVEHDLDEDVINETHAGVLFKDIPSSLVDEGVVHFGDLDYHNGHLYVPCEGTLPPKIALFTAHNISYVSSAPLATKEGKLTQGDEAAWCAINPFNSLLYSSPSNTNHLCVYKFAVEANNLTLEYIGDFKLLDTNGNNIQLLQAVQGGVFSKKRHLYLVIDQAHHLSDESEVKNSGIFGFDMITGRLAFRMVVPYRPTGMIVEELEGITIWDLDSGKAPNIGGQIHLLMLDNDEPDRDDIYFKHFRITDKDKI